MAMALNPMPYNLHIVYIHQTVCVSVLLVSIPLSVLQQSTSLVSVIPSYSSCSSCSASSHAGSSFSIPSCSLFHSSQLSGLNSNPPTGHGDLHLPASLEVILPKSALTQSAPLAISEVLCLSAVLPNKPLISPDPPLPWEPISPLVDHFSPLHPPATV